MNTIQYICTNRALLIRNQDKSPLVLQVHSRAFKRRFVPSGQEFEQANFQKTKCPGPGGVGGFVFICKLVIILFHATHIFSRNNYIKKLAEVSLIMHIRTILVPKNLKKEPHSIDRVMALSALNMLIALLHVQKDL